VRCSECRGLLSEYTDRELPGPLSADLEAHLADCRHCAGEAARMGALREALGSLPPDTSRTAWADVIAASRRRRVGSGRLAVATACIASLAVVCALVLPHRPDAGGPATPPPRIASTRAAHTRPSEPTAPRAPEDAAKTAAAPSAAEGHTLASSRRGRQEVARVPKARPAAHRRREAPASPPEPELERTERWEEAPASAQMVADTPRTPGPAAVEDAPDRELTAVYEAAMTLARTGSPRRAVDGLADFAAVDPNPQPSAHAGGSVGRGVGYYESSLEQVAQFQDDVIAQAELERIAALYAADPERRPGL